MVTEPLGSKRNSMRSLRAAALDIKPDAAAAPLAVGLQKPRDASRTPPNRRAPGIFPKPAENSRCHRRGRSASHAEWPRRHQIAAAQLQRLDAEPARGQFDQAFQDVIRFRPPGAAIDAHRRGVGEDRLGARMHGGDGIDARRAMRPAVSTGEAPADGNRRPCRAAPRPGRRKPAIRVERELALRHLVAAVIVAGEAFRPRRDPFHRPAARPPPTAPAHPRDRDWPSCRSRRRHRAR